MNNTLNGKDLIKINDRIDDLKYERKLLRYKKRLIIRKNLKHILRILFILFMDIGIAATIVGAFIALLATSHYMLGFMTAMVGGGYLIIHYDIVLESISNKINSGNDNCFKHPHFDYLFKGLKEELSIIKQIFINKRKVKALKNTANLIEMTKEEEEYLKEKTKEELIEIVKSDCNLDEDNDLNYPITAPNYVPSTKNRLDDLKSLRKALAKHKNIEKDKELVKEKEKIKRMTDMYKI